VASIHHHNYGPSGTTLDGVFLDCQLLTILYGIKVRHTSDSMYKVAKTGHFIIKCLQLRWYTDAKNSFVINIPVFVNSGFGTPL